MNKEKLIEWLTHENDVLKCDAKALQAELDAYKAHVSFLIGKIESAYKVTSEIAPSVLLNKALDQSKAQSLGDVRAKAVMDAADAVIRHNDNGFCIHCSMHDYANKLKEGKS